MYKMRNKNQKRIVLKIHKFVCNVLFILTLTEY